MVLEHNRIHLSTDSVETKCMMYSINVTTQHLTLSLPNRIPSYKVDQNIVIQYCCIERNGTLSYRMEQNVAIQSGVEYLFNIGQNKMSSQYAATERGIECGHVECCHRMWNRLQSYSMEQNGATYSGIECSHIEWKRIQSQREKQNCGTYRGIVYCHIEWNCHYMEWNRMAYIVEQNTVIQRRIAHHRMQLYRAEQNTTMLSRIACRYRVGLIQKSEMIPLFGVRMKQWNDR